MLSERTAHDDVHVLTPARPLPTPAARMPAQVQISVMDSFDLRVKLNLIAVAAWADYTTLH